MATAEATEAAEAAEETVVMAKAADGTRVMANAADALVVAKVEVMAAVGPAPARAARSADAPEQGGEE